MPDHSTSQQLGRVYANGGPGRASSVLQIGLRRGFLDDLYHRILRLKWRYFFPLAFVGYVLVNSLFALGYLGLGTGIENARPGRFEDAFFFSVQTFATIGYGKMTPSGTAANALVAAEALTGVLSAALLTGLVFAKFSRPTARVLFSRVAVVAPRDGRPALMFRMANERANGIVEAQLSVVLLRSEITAEGEVVRRIHDLRLVRQRSPVFAMTWLAIHPIDEQSPLYGKDLAALAASDSEIVVSLTGMDDIFSQTIHARHSYVTTEVVWNARFADIVSKRPDGRRLVDYRKFHTTVALDDPTRQVAAPKTPGALSG